MKIMAYAQKTTSHLMKMYQEDLADVPMQSGTSHRRTVRGSEVTMGYVIAFVFGAWFGITLAALIMAGDDDE